MIGAGLGRVWRAGAVVRAVGPDWAVTRLGREARLRSGSLARRLPARPWDDLPLRRFLADPAPAEPAAYLAYRRHGAPPFFFRAADRPSWAPLLRAWDGLSGGPGPEAEEIVRGAVRLFGGPPVSVGERPDWHRNPYTGERWPADRHWTMIDELGQGDVKPLWEASRCGFVVPLVRAYWRTGDERYAERFWRLLESWRAGNPPMRGVNWRCGQEASLRVLAWCFGLHGFLDAAPTTPGRVAALAQTIAVTGYRIEATLDYALSQRNNHGISEGTGLWTIGALFPELRAAARWRAVGRRTLESQAAELIAADGSFAQHSTNYHRLMLDALVWSARLGELRQEPFSPPLVERIARSADWLHDLQDDESGEVPRYGPQDGARMLPLANGAFGDMRPTVEAARYLATRRRTFGDGPWGESLLWLFGPHAVDAPVTSRMRADRRAGEGGYYTLRSRRGFAFVRCPRRFRFRPGHADLLHVDVWWRGINVAVEAGTFSYNASPWDEALAGTAAHNTVTVDGRNQMERVGRFLWLPWARGGARIVARSAGGGIAWWEGAHDGYRRLDDPVTHRRAVVRLGDERWLVLDDLEGRQPHEFRLHWLLADYPARADWMEDGAAVSRGSVSLATPQGGYRVTVGSATGASRMSLVRGGPGAMRGWRAPVYGRLEPALSLEVARRERAVHWWTLFGPDGDRVTPRPDGGLQIEGEGIDALVAPRSAGAGPPLRRVVLSAPVPDELWVTEEGRAGVADPSGVRDRRRGGGDAARGAGATVGRRR